MAVAYGADGKFLQLPKIVHPPDHLDSVSKRGGFINSPEAPIHRIDMDILNGDM